VHCAPFGQVQDLVAVTVEVGETAFDKPGERRAMPVAGSRGMAGEFGDLPGPTASAEASQGRQDQTTPTPGLLTVGKSAQRVPRVSRTDRLPLFPGGRGQNVTAARGGGSYGSFG